MRFMRWLDRAFEETIAVGLLAAIVVLVCVNVIARYGLNASLPWGEELVGWIFVWFIWIATSYVFRLERHIEITLLPDLLPEGPQRALRLVVRLAVVAFLVTVSWRCIELMLNPMVRNQLSVVLKMPIPLYYASAPAGALLSTARLLQSIWRDLRAPTATTARGELL